MLDYATIKADLESKFQIEKAEGVDIDINVNVISETNGKFSISVHNNRCILLDEYLDKADITVGFVNKDTMIEMFTQGADPVKLVMGGKMTFNGDMSKGKSMKGLFVA
jgi:putative sterol carrier protein|tara:strand:+ start:1069 stop:1392 length:324 start_codon:yes stop_codon:yes gene_type:complete